MADARVPRRFRRILTGALVLLVMVIIGALLIYVLLQTAPVTVNTVRSEETPDATAEATDEPAADLQIAGGGAGEIAFLSNRDGNWEIYAISGDASSPRNITNHPANDWFASYALNGEKMTILSDRSGQPAPVLTNPDGTEAEELTVFGAITTLIGQRLIDWDPQWPPKGTVHENALLWVSLRDLNLEVYMLSDTAAPDSFNRYTVGFAYDWFPAWSPDGTQIAFTSERDGNLEIYVMPAAFTAAGADQTRLTNEPADDIYAVWSLDGEKLLFVSERETSLLDGFFDLYLMDADGSEAQPLGETIFEGDPSWSPDGSQMVYMSNRDGDFELYLRDVASGAERQLTDNDADDLFPIWRP